MARKFLSMMAIDYVQFPMYNELFLADNNTSTIGSRICYRNGSSTHNKQGD